MQLDGSCHCSAVTFSVQSKYPYPFNRCYCSVCRKIAGGGGYAINLSADNKTLTVEGKENLSVYQVKIKESDSGKSVLSPARRSFCKHCGTALWVWDPRWPELLHPFASAIDSELPVPPERTHLMLGSKASWVEPRTGEPDQQFQEYPNESIAAWHERLGLER